jgi:hypothetical protein
MQRHAISLAIEYDPTRGFRDHLRSYRDNDDEIPTHTSGTTLFQAIAGGLLPRSAVPNIDNVLLALDHMRTEFVPYTWAIAAGAALTSPAPPPDGSSFFPDETHRRIVARLAAIARFDEPSGWTVFWNKTSVGIELLAEITMLKDSVEWVTKQDIAGRTAVNIAILENMRADGVDLATLRSQYGPDQGALSPLLHSATSQQNIALAGWLLEAGLDPHQKTPDPSVGANAGAVIDCFDVARIFCTPVLHLFEAWKSRRAMKASTLMHKPA